jgi:rhomboid protease GluP
MQLIEIYRSSRLAACEQRAFVLHAVGIASEIVAQNDEFALWVPTEAAALAQHHIDRYAAESVPAPPEPAPVMHANAAIAPLVYAFTLIGIAYFAGKGTFGVDWYEVGALRASAKLDGEWYRALTALTLHSDHPHLLGNVGFGMYFSYLAARLLGWGVALGSMVLAAAAGNVLDSVLMPASHSSVGASTMVFATLGLIAAYSWRQKFDRRMRWVHRWSPLIAGVMLLGLIGSGGENTDVLAHLTGFACGALLGAAYGRATNVFFDRRVQLSAALTAAAAISSAWWLAIH